MQDTLNDSMRKMTIFGRIGLGFSGRAFLIQEFHKPDEKEPFRNKVAVKISDPSLKWRLLFTINEKAFLFLAGKGRCEAFR